MPKMTLKRAEEIFRDMPSHTKEELQRAASRMREGYEAGSGSYNEVQWRGHVGEHLQAEVDART